MSAEPIELIAKTTGRVVGFACGKCSCTTMMMFPGSYLGTDEERLDAARNAAIEHCVPCFCACGNERKRYFGICEKCHDRQLADEIAAKERAAFEKAEKVPAAEWNGEYVWSDRFEEIFGHIGDLLGCYEDECEKPPAYVWECERCELSLDAANIIDREIDNQEAWEGLRDQISVADMNELQVLLDEWLDTRKLHWWREEHARAVLLRSCDDEPTCE